MPSASRIVAREYRALAELRYVVRRFLSFSAEAARAANVEPQQHQLLLAIKGLPPELRPTIGVAAERLQLQHHSAGRTPAPAPESNAPKGAAIGGTQFGAGARRNRWSTENKRTKTRMNSNNSVVSPSLCDLNPKGTSGCITGAAPALAARNRQSQSRRANVVVEHTS